MTNPLFTGAPLTEELFSEFVERLRHDCVGAGLAEHCTADVAFLVHQKEYIYGIDIEYADTLAILCGEAYYHSVLSFMAVYHDNCIEELQALGQKLHGKAFEEIDEFEQFLVIGELDGFSVHGYQENWAFVNLHLTQSSADEFVRKHGHKYKGELRVSQESQYRSHEFNAIKNALIKGDLIWKA